MSDIEGILPDLGGISLAALPEAKGLDEHLARVLERVDRPTTLISGYNGAGGSVDTSAVDVVELPHD